MKSQTSFSYAAAGKAFDRGSWRSLIAWRYALSWAALGLLALCAWIPARLRDLIAVLLSYILVLLPIKARRISYVNMRLAFPDFTAGQCRELYRKSLAVGISVMLAYGEPSFLPAFMLKRRWKVHGMEHLNAAVADGRPIIFAAPHAFAIDRCGLYLSAHGLHMCTMVHKQRNPVYDWFLNQQRLRFKGTVYERSAGLRTIIRELRSGHSCFFLPDEDLGAENSRFIPLFGAPKATVASLPKLARVGHAQVMQLFSAYNFKSACFELYFSPVFASFPSDDLDADLRLMNQYLEQAVRMHRSQYMWFLRYFKTVPDQSYPNIYAGTEDKWWRKHQTPDYQGRKRPYQEVCR